MIREFVFGVEPRSEANYEYPPEKELCNKKMTKSNYKACENDCKDCMEKNFMLEYACKKGLDDDRRRRK